MLNADRQNLQPVEHHSQDRIAKLARREVGISIASFEQDGSWVNPFWCRGLAFLFFCAIPLTVCIIGMVDLAIFLSSPCLKYVSLEVACLATVGDMRGSVSGEVQGCE